MAFYPNDAHVPDGLKTDEWVIRPLRVSDVELDYDAVISSRAELWLRSGGAWPREGFTLEENLTDLEQHEQEHDDRVAFTYTVMNPTETVCLGCLYLTPLAQMLERVGGSTSQVNDVGEHDAVVTFWVRQSRLSDNLDARLLPALLAWFKTEWVFTRTVFLARKAQERQIALFERVGLDLLYTLPNAVVYGPSN